MATTTDYCLRQDLIDRLSAAGVIAVADDGGDDVVREEEALALDQAIREAARLEIDVALRPWMALPLIQDESNLNELLRWLCVDLAIERVAGRKGREVPESFAARATAARKRLEAIREGERVPLLAYPTDREERAKRAIGWPLLANPCDKEGRKRWQS